MTDTISTDRRTPWHLWAVGVVSLLWNGFGCFDFIMSASRGEAYYRSMGMTDAQIDIMAAYPAWMWPVWFVGVFGGLAGSLLLLLRRKLAVPAWAASLVAAIISVIYCAFLSDMIETLGVGMIVMPIVIVIVAGFLLWYARAMTKRGALR
jgi:bacteriorhodopsin